MAWYRTVNVWQCLLLLWVSMATDAYTPSCGPARPPERPSSHTRTGVGNTTTPTNTDFLAAVIMQLSWTHLSLVTDHEEMVRGNPVHMEGVDTLVQVYQVNTTNFHPHLQSISSVLQNLDTDAVLLVGSETFQMEAVRQMKKLSTEDGLSRRVIDTQWLLVCTGDVLLHVDITSLLLNNVAVALGGKNSQPRFKTLLWTPEGRHLADVTIGPSGVTSGTLYPNQDHGLSGMHIRVGINPWDKYIVASQRNGTLKYTGLCMDLLDILALSLNFSYSLVLPPDGEWGDKRDGQWTGLIGLIQRQEVDVTVAPLGPHPERVEVSDWSSTPFDYWYNGMALVVPRESDLSLWSSFLSPFTWQVYLSICIIFSVTLKIVMCLLLPQRPPARYDTGNHACNHCCCARWLDVGIFLFGTILSRAMPAGDLGCTDSRSRLFLACWYLLALVLTASYGSKLTSLMVDVPSPPPFSSLADMTSQDSFRWGTTGGTIYFVDFRESDDDVKRTLYQKMVSFAEEDPDVLSLDMTVHLQKVLSGGYAFFGEGAQVEGWAALHCNISVIPGDISGVISSYNVFTPKGSALLGRIDTLLLQLYDTGVLSYLRNKWIPRPTSCHSNVTSPKVITMATLQGPCYLAVFALIAAVLTLLLERLFMRTN